MKVMHIASEIAPYSKTGGLGDVLAALPRALGDGGVEVIVVTPRYRSVDPERFGLARRLRTLSVALGDETVEVGLYEGAPPSSSRVRYSFVAPPASFHR